MIEILFKCNYSSLRCITNTFSWDVLCRRLKQTYKVNISIEKQSQPLSYVGWKYYVKLIRKKPAAITDHDEILNSCKFQQNIFHKLMKIREVNVYIGTHSNEKPYGNNIKRDDWEFQVVWNIIEQTFCSYVY